ncbi:hypothetical protein [Parafrankia sp. BMG5.11]|uniref:hypothetical protein n=1 Tax=Parafrankia sp. BMG5.11 TaxID=222540 RepID=UPI00103D0B15|nr:hypothetical protein [Parafrankia sp. BMG5.11]TCJ37375.1 hypothetical protein E0504_20270 [Parafrankia sp. BMG5.11]
MKSHEEWIGKTKLRVQPAKNGSGWFGTTIRDAKAGEILQDDNRDRLLTRLRNEAGKLEPGYFGMSAAIERFLKFMPGGFAGQRIQKERVYKVKASQALNAILPADQALSATRANADAVRKAPAWINILSPYESMHLKETIEGPQGPSFLAAAARFALGERDAGIIGMRKAMRGHGAFTWPILTYFPYLWEPGYHMFLKPTVTRDFAERVGHSFQYRYDPVATSAVYEALLELTDDTREALRNLAPADNIDVQSFIWVVGGYTDADLPSDNERGGDGGG